MNLEITNTAILVCGAIWAVMFVSLVWYLVRDELNPADSPKSKRWWQEDD